ncbi:MAG: hypothetical protein HKO77_00375 [Gemmatimonadetes bacterium]|nr:hypothetical protein [Gemmatimonadota bacterium]NNL29439.1 hypothetical protein [Gemmatimonadota bacterium]
MKKTLSILAMMALAACGGDVDDEGRTAADTLTRAQKDSIVADLPIPGAGAVGAAMRSRDRANERTAVHDSIG